MSSLYCIMPGLSRGISYYMRNQERQKAYKREHGVALKLEVLTFYGKGKCACVTCGESRLPCLSIDHTNGRSREPEGALYGVYLYKCLKRNNFPEGYQTLCMNCQWIKRHNNGEYLGKELAPKGGAG